MATDWSELDRIVQGAEDSGCSIGVTIVDQNQTHYRHRDNEIFLAASTIKIAVMVSVFQMVDDGGVTLDDTIVLRREDMVPGSGVLQEIHDAVVLTLSDLLYLMTSISDNPSTNLLIDLVGLEKVNWPLRQLGLAQSTLIREMEGRPARGMDNENLSPLQSSHGLWS